MKYLLPPHHTHEAPSASGGAAIIVVDDDGLGREPMRAMLEDEGRVVECYGSRAALLKAPDPGQSAYLLVDAYLPGMSGLGIVRLTNSEWAAQRACLFGAGPRRRAQSHFDRRQRRSQCFSPAIETTTSSRCHLSPRAGARRRIRLASTILIIILLSLIFGGGGGYYAHSYYGAPGLGGVLGLVLVVCIVLWLIGRVLNTCARRVALCRRCESRSAAKEGVGARLEAVKAGKGSHPFRACQGLRGRRHRRNHMVDGRNREREERAEP